MKETRHAAKAVFASVAMFAGVSQAEASPVTLSCAVIDWQGSTPMDPVLPRPTNMKWTISFDTNGAKADVIEEQTRDGDEETVELLGDLVLTPGFAKIKARDTRTPTVFVDYALEVDRSDLRFKGAKVLAGLMNVRFSGSCKLVKTPARPKQF